MPSSVPVTRATKFSLRLGGLESAFVHSMANSPGMKKIKNRIFLASPYHFLWKIILFLAVKYNRIEALVREKGLSVLLSLLSSGMSCQVFAEVTTETS